MRSKPESTFFFLFFFPVGEKAGHSAGRSSEGARCDLEERVKQKIERRIGCDRQERVSRGSLKVSQRGGELLKRHESL